MFNMVKIDDELRQLDRYSLADLAEYFDKQAEICRQKALEDTENAAEKQAGAVDFLMRTPRIVMRHLRLGCTLTEAQQKTAALTGAPLGSIENAWSRFCSDKSTYELRRRNRVILELAGMGFANADISRKMALHPNSVSRIISQARSAYHAPRAKGDDLTALPSSDGTIF